MTVERERIDEARETQRVLKRVLPIANATPEDVVALHELHAKHERKHGREMTAEEAERRAERARQRGN